MVKRLKIGLALGAGGAKGLAHIGVIKTLIAAGIPIDYIAGSSIGALVGGFFAYSEDIQGIEKLALETNWPQLFSIFFDPAPLGRGLVSGKRIQKFIHNYLGSTEFEDLKINFTAVATNLTKGEPEPIRSGSVGQAVRASISVPLIFQPVNIGGQIYADGGLTMTVPTETVRKMGADVVIAVNLSENYQGLDINSKLSLNLMFNKTLDIYNRHSARRNIERADIVITPTVGSVGLFDKFLTREGTTAVIKAGETCTKAHLEQIQTVCGIKKSQINPLTKLWNKFSQLFYPLT